MQFKEANPYSVLDEGSLRVWSKHSVAVAVEQAPRELILHVDPNPIATELLPKDLSYLTNPDWLVGHTFLTVHPETPSATTVPIAWGWGRSIPVEYGYYPYGVALGGVIQSKGTWLSGRYYLKNTCSMGGAGLFETEGALAERKAANALLAHGFRASLPLGDVYMNEYRTEQWLREKNRGHNDDDVGDSFHALHEWGDDPVVSFFVTGGTERLDYFNAPPFLGNRLPMEIRASAQLMLQELRLGMTRLSKSGDDVTRNAREAVLMKMANGEDLTAHEARVMVHIGIDIFAANAAALKRVTEGMPMDWNMLSLPKDVDFALITSDFEEAFRDPSYHQDPAFKYLKTTGYLRLWDYKDFVLQSVVDDSISADMYWNAQEIETQLIQGYTELL